jgi:hypothetical protein
VIDKNKKDYRDTGDDKNAPRIKIFYGKKYSYGGFYTAAELKKDKPNLQKMGYSVRAIPHPQGSGYNVYYRLKRPGE